MSFRCSSKLIESSHQIITCVSRTIKLIRININNNLIIKKPSQRTINTISTYNKEIVSRIYLFVILETKRESIAVRSGMRQQ